MSDPVTNVEIEDVLSSIRRLVSAEERGDNNETVDDTEAQESADKLVLTPAQRVDEETGQDFPEGDDWQEEPEVGATASNEDDDRFDGIEDAEIVESSETAEEHEEPVAHAELPEFLTRRHSEMNDDVEEAVSEDERSAVEADAEDWEDTFDEAPETTEVEPEFEAEQEVEAETEPEPKFEPEHEPEFAAEAEAEELGEATQEPDEEEPSAIEARVAGFEDAVAEQDEVWEPDGMSGDDYSGGPVEPLPWSDIDELAEEPESEDAAEASQGAAGSGVWYDDDAVLDEDALRDMVSEIVRQELQGALGERITRNVRKLVRREINRALMSQGIE